MKRFSIKKDWKNGLETSEALFCVQHPAHLLGHIKERLALLESQIS